MWWRNKVVTAPLTKRVLLMLLSRLLPVSRSRGLQCPRTVH